MNVNTKAKYDIVVYHSGYRLLISKRKRLSKPLALVLSKLPEKTSIAIISRPGYALFGGPEKDIELGTTYGGDDSCDFRCANAKTLIGYKTPKLTNIQRCKLGQKFNVRKEKKACSL